MKNLKKNFNLVKAKIANFINLDHCEKEMVRKWRNHRSIRKWMYKNYLISEKEHLAFIKSLKTDNSNFYWLVKDMQDNPLGVISLQRLNKKNKNAYLGIYSNPFLKERGAGKMLRYVLLKIVFKIARLHCLKAEVLENNTKAIKYYKKLGFKKEGVLTEFVRRDNRWANVIVMGITKR